MKFLGSDAVMTQPKVFLPVREAKKIWAWTLSVPGEINGLGLVERRKNNFWVTEVLILKERVSHGRATIDPLAFNEYVSECEDPSKIRMQWHSHGDISADFFSQKDISDTIAKWTGEYLISLLVNKRGEYRCRLDIFEPIYLGFEIPLLVTVPVEKEILDFCREEIKEKVAPLGHGFIGKARQLFRQKPGAGWNQEEEPLAIPFDNFRFSAEEEEGG